jgi:hypothetical protein
MAAAACAAPARAHSSFATASISTRKSGPADISGTLLDLIEFTLLKACLEAGRLEDARRLLNARRAGASRIPVSGVAALH